MSSLASITTTRAPRGQRLSRNLRTAQIERLDSSRPVDSPQPADFSQPSIVIGSVKDAEHHLLSYLGSDYLDDLHLQIPWTIFVNERIEEVLRSAKKQKRRFAYDRETSVLRVYAIARPVHGAIYRFVDRFLVAARETGFMTKEERECIGLSNDGERLAGKLFHAELKTKKLHAWTKFPDAIITFGDIDSEPRPSIIFEVGFTERYDDLVSDAWQWLTKSKGKVRLVVLVDVKEDIQSRTARKKSNKARRRIKALMKRFGNAQAKDRSGIDYDADATSDDEMYENLKSAIAVEDWVGPIQAKLELWHMVNGDPRQRGEQIVLLPEPPKPQNPIINITDIVPESNRDDFANFDTSKKTELDMDVYRRLLIAGIRKLAFYRALDHLRPRVKNE